MVQQVGEDTSPMQTSQLPPKATALIIDDQIVDILYTDERISSILLSNPIIVDLTDAMNDPVLSKRPAIGWAYSSEQNAVIGSNDGNDPIVVNI